MGWNGNCNLFLPAWRALPRWRIGYPADGEASNSRMGRRRPVSAASLAFLIKSSDFSIRLSCSPEGMLHTPSVDVMMLSMPEVSCARSMAHHDWHECRRPKGYASQ